MNKPTWQQRQAERTKAILEKQKEQHVDQEKFEQAFRACMAYPPFKLVLLYFDRVFDTERNLMADDKMRFLCSTYWRYRRETEERYGTQPREAQTGQTA